MYYIQVPSHVYLDKRLNRTEQNLYGLLISLSYKDGHCYATNKALSDMLEVSMSMISKSISKLKSLDLITLKMNDLGNFRTIITLDTVNGAKRLKKQNDDTLTADKAKTKQTKTNKIVRYVPEWLNEFEQMLEQRGE